MKPCKKAEQNLKDTAKGILLASTIWGWLSGDMRITSIANNAIQTSKYVLKTDKPTQNDVGRILGCRLRKFLNKVF